MSKGEGGTNRRWVKSGAHTHHVSGETGKRGCGGAVETGVEFIGNTVWWGWGIGTPKPNVTSLSTRTVDGE